MSSPAPVGVFGDHNGVGCALAAGLADRGHGVALVCPSAAHEAVAGCLRDLEASTVATFPCADDATGIAQALDSARRSLGSLTGVVDASSPGAAGVPAELAGMADDEWEDRTAAPLRQALHRLQGCHHSLHGTGGHVVLILPSLSLTGAPGLVAWASVTEGRRALAKAAARAWGGAGITVNCVAVPAAMLAAGDGGTAPPSLDRPGLPPPSLGGPPDARRDVAGVVSHLVGSDLSVLTGQTVAVDGGVWMAP